MPPTDRSGRAHEFAFRTPGIASAARAAPNSWLYRTTLSFALLAGECAMLSIVWRTPGGIGIWIAFASSWLVLFLLPRPVPRLLLLAGRLLAMSTTAGALMAAQDWLAQMEPRVKPWNGVVLFVTAGGLMAWSLLALRRSSVTHAQSSAANQAGSGIGQREWSSVPTVSFLDVGGAEEAKAEIRMIAENRFRGRGAPVIRNGVLLHGPQGTGKNLLAEATAGEYRANFHHVRCPELIAAGVGSSAGEIRRVFEWAVQRRPIVLFLDEIDSIGSRKQVQGSQTDPGGGGREFNSMVTQLMQSIDQMRSLDGLLLMAATNYLDGLEPTLVREGRFDAKLRLDLPNAEAREAILRAQLSGLKANAQSLAEIARRTPGWSPARLRSLVDRAALLAEGSVIENRHLITALKSGGGKDRPMLETVTWDDVILPEVTAQDVRTLLRLLEPGAAEKLGVPPPTGVVLVGPPGVGKTLTGRLIASQTKRSFYPVSPGSILTGAVGGSVQRLADVFARAKENAPSILFFDEMDALFPSTATTWNLHDVQLVEQGLIEISALSPEHHVFLIGTSDDLSRVDSRMLRGGRFSEKIEIGLPDKDGIRMLIELHFGTSQLDRSLANGELQRRLRGMTPARIGAVAAAARRCALTRVPEGRVGSSPLSTADLDAAVSRVRE